MRALLLAAALSCATTPTRDRAAAAPPTPVGEPCGAGDVDRICKAAREPITVGSNPIDAPIVDANTTYEVAGFAANKRGYLVLEAQESGAYTLYLGGPPVTARLGDELPTCTGAAAACMRTAATYTLDAGERYELELGPIPSGQRVVLHVHAPASGEHVVRAKAETTRGETSSEARPVGVARNEPGTPTE